jgi:hypothetical protein
VLPAQVSLLLRTLVLLEGTSRLFSPGFSLAEVIQPFYAREVGRRLSPRRLLARVQRTYRDWDRLLLALPRDLGDVLARVRAGTFSVRLDHRHLDPAVNRLVMGILTASLFLGSSLLWSMKAPPLLGGVSVFGVAGYLASVHLGWRAAACHPEIRQRGSQGGLKPEQIKAPAAPSAGNAPPTIPWSPRLPSRSPGSSRCLECLNGSGIRWRRLS